LYRHKNEIISNEENIKNMWKTYLQDLLNTATISHNTFLDNTHSNDTETEQELKNEPPDILDIELAIQSMNNNKSPGIDNVRIELSTRKEENC
jgi:hypothetical protein